MCPFMILITTKFLVFIFCQYVCSEACVFLLYVSLGGKLEFPDWWYQFILSPAVNESSIRHLHIASPQYICLNEITQYTRKFPKL